jgi:hypothetical protein
MSSLDLHHVSLVAGSFYGHMFKSPSFSLFQLPIQPFSEHIARKKENSKILLLYNTHNVVIALLLLCSKICCLFLGTSLLRVPSAEKGCTVLYKLVVHVLSSSL